MSALPDHKALRAEVSRQVQEYDCCETDAMENLADQYGVSYFVVEDALADRQSA